MNTLLIDRELAEWAALARQAALAGVDAFIVQDLGGAAILRRTCPDIPLHASTQMTVHNTPGAHALAAYGFSRVILARELTAGQIVRITSDSGVRTEVFVHGALCVCYSGQCLMSSMLGGRSANRGMCAQPCRLPYSRDGEEGYLLSTKDLCLAAHIGTLASAGVASIKIEGRMKRPEYVAAVTRVYRKALDGLSLTRDDHDMLALAFNRGGFTAGMFTEDERRLYTVQPGHLGLAAGCVTAIAKKRITLRGGRPLAIGDEIRPGLPDAQPREIKAVSRQGAIQTVTVNDASGFSLGAPALQVSSATQMNELRQSISGNARRTPLYASIEIREGVPATLRIRAGQGAVTTVYSELPAQKAQNRPVTQQDIEAQLKRTGDTPFYFKRIDYHLSPHAAFPRGGLNALRREALANIEADILDNYRHTPLAYVPIARKRRDPVRPRIAVQAATPEQAAATLNACDMLYVPLEADWPDMGKQTAGIYPRITSDSELKALLHRSEKYDALMVGGLLPVNGRKLGDTGLNVMNSEALTMLSGQGFSRVTLSTELNAAQLAGLTVPAGLETELIVYGRSMLMITEHCPIDCERDRCLAREGAALKDRKGMTFPIVRVYGGRCRVGILNTLPVYMADRLADLNADVLRLVFTVEPPEECSRVARLYRAALDGETNLDFGKEYTRGHFYRGVGTLL